jgi:hypothetical protein
MNLLKFLKKSNLIFMRCTQITYNNHRQSLHNIFLDLLILVMAQDINIVCTSYDENSDTLVDLGYDS